jgi:hypothetical protein
VSEEYPYAAKAKITTLIESLETLIKRDPEQEGQGIALPVLDAAVEHTRSFLPDDPVVNTIRGVVSPDQIASGEPVRAADALVVAKQLDAAIGPHPLMVG